MPEKDINWIMIAFAKGFRAGGAEGDKDDPIGRTYLPIQLEDIERRVAAAFERAPEAIRKARIAGSSNATLYEYKALDRKPSFKIHRAVCERLMAMINVYPQFCARLERAEQTDQSRLVLDFARMYAGLDRA